MACKLKFQEKVAIVTGGSSGIIKGCVDVLGKTVVIHGCTRVL